jgi:hypothetical protein
VTVQAQFAACPVRFLDTEDHPALRIELAAIYQLVDPGSRRKVGVELE